MNATELVFDGSTGGRIERTISGLTSGADYSVSLYARVASGTQDVNFGSFQDETFTLTTEWQRLEKRQPENDANAYPRIICNDVATIEIYGFQHELGSYSSSYIPNHGTSGGVTRAADACSVTGVSDVIGQTEGTIYLDVNISRVIGNEAIGNINSGGYTNNTTFQRIGNAIQFVRSSATQSGASVVSSGTIAAGHYKMAIAYKSGNTVFFLNGTQVGTTQTQTFTNGTMSVLRLGSDAIGSLPISDSYKQATLFKERLTNAELATLTTL